MIYKFLFIESPFCVFKQNRQQYLLLCHRVNHKGVILKNQIGQRTMQYSFFPKNYRINNRSIRLLYGYLIVFCKIFLAQVLFTCRIAGFQKI